MPYRESIVTAIRKIGIRQKRYPTVEKARKKESLKIPFESILF
jgi:hypothetical protein